ncbi:uncharacterized protein BCR38DRAFT_472437 [Pseudomassariella vexata]|uniref:Zn(2)-C6 fungal-type domain-containing protein n=1 Tax=Pseudomassariella vexata TaxID=1141098 RepID=A0A1Y2EBU4_9PEZI|nr:uncharacterized protein BCR38DRAFT_472437 [Pseudomassariella vexata]ORY69028.1 hypothetical protein BCR38DRAFT_472437 [Pseudomassariella vexata]
MSPTNRWDAGRTIFFQDRPGAMTPNDDNMDVSKAEGHTKRPVFRKRAPKACLKCRERKVRCNVVREGQPCTNCRLDGHGCAVTPRAKKPRKCPGGATAARQTLVGSCIADDDISGRIPSTVPSLEHLDNVSVDIDCWGMPILDICHFDSPSGMRTGDPTPKGGGGVAHCHVHGETGQSARETPSSEPVHFEAEVLFSSHSFLNMWKVLDIGHGDIRYLESQGCLRVPTKSILDEFLRNYFLHVHPMLPLLNERDFWDMYCGEDFLRQESVRILGFSTIQAARASFYRRAKLLYDFETETDPIAIAQAALLLTYWCPGSSSGLKQPNSAWLGVAIQQAKAAEADKYATMATVHTKRQNILKRVWWCCIIRDRIMPLCVRRNIQITRNHFDFNANASLDYEDLSDEIEHSRVYHGDSKRSLTAIMALMTELCVCLTDILELVYPFRDTAVCGAEVFLQKVALIKEYREALLRWSKRATMILAVFPDTHDVSRFEEGSHNDSVVLYTNLIWIYYHSSRAALCNYELHISVMVPLPRLSEGPWEYPATIQNNRKELWDATTSISDCLKKLIRLGLTRWLPSSAVGCTALPLALHMLDIKLSSASSTPAEILSANPRVVEKQRRLNILIQAMKEYRPQHDCVGWVSRIIRHIMDFTHLDIATPPSWHCFDSKYVPWEQHYDGDWTDILSKNPACYLRMALAIDLSLSKDRLPEEEDFPQKLRESRRNNGRLLSALGPQASGGTAKAEEQPSSELDDLSPGLPAAILQTMAAWIQNDRSLHFAQEMGLGLKSWTSEEEVLDTFDAAEDDDRNNFPTEGLLSNVQLEISEKEKSAFGEINEQMETGLTQTLSL